MRKISFIILTTILLFSIGNFVKADGDPTLDCGQAQPPYCYQRIIGTSNTSLDHKLWSRCIRANNEEGLFNCWCQGSNNMPNCHVGGLISNPICACCGDCTANDFLGLGLNIANIILKYLGVIALVMFIFGGIMWMTSAGSEEKVKKGKTVIMGAVVGMAIVLSAYVIVQMLMQALHTEGYLKGEKCTVNQSTPNDGSCIEAGSRYKDYSQNKVDGFECRVSQCAGGTTICCKPK